MRLSEYLGKIIENLLKEKFHLSNKGENIVAQKKEIIAHYEDFFLMPHYFQKLSAIKQW